MIGFINAAMYTVTFVFDTATKAVTKAGGDSGEKEIKEKLTPNGGKGSGSDSEETGKKLASKKDDKANSKRNHGKNKAGTSESNENPRGGGSAEG